LWYIKEENLQNRQGNKSQNTYAYRQVGEEVMKIFFLIFLISGIVTLFCAIGSLEKAKTSENWPTTEGQVVSSDIVTGIDWRRTGKDRRTYTTYKPIVLYEYSVNDTKYSSNMVSFVGEDESEMQGHARRIVNRYPPGKKVIVYYNPDNPKEAVLETGVSPITYVATLVMGIAFCAVGLWGVIRSLKKF